MFQLDLRIASPYKGYHYYKMFYVERVNKKKKKKKNYARGNN